MELSESTMLFTIFALLSVAIFIKRGLNHNKSMNLPPSPAKLPVIGNLHQLGDHPHRTLTSLARRYGPLMLLRFGSVPVLVASSVDAARDIMKTYDHFLANRPRSKAAEKLLYNCRDVAFAPYGEYWRQIKSVCVIHLLSNKMVRSFRHVREEEIKIMMNKIDRSISNRKSINLSDVLATLTNDVICRVALGKKYAGGEFKPLLLKFAELLGGLSIGEFIPWLAWVDRISGLDYELNKTAKGLDAFLEEVVREHMGRSCEFRSENGPLDFVDVLLTIQREKTIGFEIDMLSIKAIILDVFAAGTETTFALLEWTMTELLRHPQAMAKLQEEVRTITGQRSHVSEDDLHRMDYLKAVEKETLRLHPPVPMLVPRQSKQALKIQGYDVPAGTQVFINAWAIGRDPTIWGEDAEEFRPERFLNSKVDYRGTDFRFVPFGAGRRICPGISFSGAVYELAMANIIHRYDWTVAVGSTGEMDMAESKGLTVHRKFPMVVSASPASRQH